MKKIISIIFAIIIVFSFSSIANAQVNKEQYYARSTLSGNELEYYDALYKEMLNGYGLDGSDYGIDEERADEIEDYVYMDAPEIINFYRIYSDDEVVLLNKQLNEKAQEILLKLDGGMTDYEKVKTIYYYLGENIQYDHEALSDLNNGKKSTEAQDCQTIVGGLINQKAICSGIAHTLQYVLYQADIYCYLAGGTRANSLHTWNMIQIDSKWYYADLTADLDYIKYNQTPIYFLCGQDTIDMTHKMVSPDGTNLNPPLPECPEEYKPTPKPLTTPRPTPQPTYEPVQANTPEPQEDAAETFAKPENSTDYTLWYVLGSAAVAAVLIVLAVRKKKKA